MPKQVTPARPSEEHTIRLMEFNEHPVKRRKNPSLERLPEQEDKDLFFSFFAGLEAFPIARSEIARIIGQPESRIKLYEKRGIILRSVKNEWRPDAQFAAFNFYDLYRLAIIQSLHLLPFCGNEIFENLIDELLDELCLEID